MTDEETGIALPPREVPPAGYLDGVRDRILPVLENLKREYTPDLSKVQPLRFFCSGDEYQFWGAIPGRFHFVCPAEDGTFFLLGTAETFADNASSTMLPMLVHRDDLALACETLDLLNFPKPRRHLVLNRADDKVGLTADKVETTLDMKIAQAIPTSPEVANATNAGEPIAAIIYTDIATDGMLRLLGDLGVVARLKVGRTAKSTVDTYWLCISGADQVESALWLFPPHERGSAMGIFGIGVVLAPALGPWVGGLLMEIPSRPQPRDSRDGRIHAANGNGPSCFIAQNFAPDIRPENFSGQGMNHSYGRLKFTSVRACLFTRILHYRYIIRMQQFPWPLKSFQISAKYFLSVCGKYQLSFRQIPVPYSHACRHHAFLQALLCDAKRFSCITLLSNVKPFRKNSRDRAIRLDDGLIDEVHE